MWHAVRRDRWIIVGFCIAAIAGGALLTWLQTPEYEGETTLFVNLDKELGGGTPFGSVESLALLGSLTGGAGSMSTEIGVLTSRSIAETVVDSLDLHVQIMEPQMSRAGVLSVIDAPRDARAAEYLFSLGEYGRYQVAAIADSAPPAEPAVVEPGSTVQLGDVVVSLQPTLRDNPPEEIRIEIRRFQAVVSELRENLLVEQLEGGARILSVRVRHADSLLAAAIPNMATASFVEYKTRTNKADARATVEFLRDQVQRYADDLTAAETELQRFQERMQVISPSDQASARVQEISEFRARRDMLAAEREALRDVVAAAETTRSDETAPSPYRKLAAFPALFANPAVQNILASLTTLETERSAMLVNRTPEYPDVKQLTNRIEELELQLYRTAVNYLRSLDSQIASLDETLARFGREVELVPAQQVEYQRLYRQRELLERIYSLLQTQLKEAEIREASESVDVRVLDPALVPRNPASPRPALNLALAGIVGLMLGLGSVFYRAVLDPKVRTRNDTLAATGGAPVIGAIPRLELAASSNGRRRSSGRLLVPTGLGRRRSRPVGGLITSREPGSPVAEAYRGLRTSVLLLDREQAPQLILVTSPMAGEGKSVSVSNLALALAQQGTRTLLIDADLRQGSLHEIFGIAQSPGLADLLNGQASLDEAIKATPVDGKAVALDVLASGIRPSNPSELLGSARMRQLLEELRGRYGMILVDAPPLHVVTDASVIGVTADCTLLIVRAGTTHKRALAEAVAELDRLNIPLAGVVVNDIDSSEMPYYRYGYGQLVSG